MKNAIIIHGRPTKEEYYALEYPSCSNAHWLPWLQNQLLANDIKADTPEMPHAYHPSWDVWCAEFERFDVTSETILVGHSCGAGFLIRWLSERSDVSVAKLILVAPYLAPSDGVIHKPIDTDFFEFQIDPDLTDRCDEMVIFNSTNDDLDIHQSVKMIQSQINNATYCEFENMGHFCEGDLNTQAFPDLLKVCLQ